MFLGLLPAAMSGDTWLVETLDTAALVLQAIFEAHPREWTDAAPAWLYAGPGDAPQLRPFLRAQVRRPGGAAAVLVFYAGPANAVCASAA